MYISHEGYKRLLEELGQLKKVKRRALSKEIEISTIKMAEETGSTQQTMSRKMIELSEKGLIERSASTKGVRVSRDTIKTTGTSTLLYFGGKTFCSSG